MGSGELIYFEDLKYLKAENEIPCLTQKLKYTLFGYSKKDVGVLLNQISLLYASAQKRYLKRAVDLSDELRRERNQRKDMTDQVEELAAQKNEAERKLALLINENKLQKRKIQNLSVEYEDLLQRMEKSENGSNVRLEQRRNISEAPGLKEKLETLDDLYKNAASARDKLLSENARLVRETLSLREICRRNTEENELLNQHIYEIMDCIRKPDCRQAANKDFENLRRCIENIVSERQK